MKTSQIMISTCCVLSVIFSLCYATPHWRPQGRFGKRTTEDDNVPDFGISRLQDIPIELMFSKNELSRRNSKPRLCSTSGVVDTRPAMHKSMRCK
uniref:Cardioexcitatory peptide n=1 Tax=Lymnaea stagnalis TaxID=6523 RepID=O97371_LYMST|nr:cardioexcitatory peptide precursor [Lymnaea stagnalis]